MEHQLTIYNTLDRKKELFVPLHAPHVGMYVCGPTVYGDAHLGHARPSITFDVLFRYLTHLGYKVRYVRNITDVGHLEHDADDGEDKIAKKARLEELEPMEVVQYVVEVATGKFSVVIILVIFGYVEVNRAFAFVSVSGVQNLLYQLNLFDDMSRSMRFDAW